MASSSASPEPSAAGGAASTLKTNFTSVLSANDNDTEWYLNNHFLEYNPLDFTTQMGFPQTLTDPSLFHPHPLYASITGHPTVLQKRLGWTIDENDVGMTIKGEDEFGEDGFSTFTGETGVSVNDGEEVDGGDQMRKRKKNKGFPAKNLMAERRRRKKLNDSLFMLRAVVPKISKMDKASILGDAIDYMKELMQKITYLHNELQTTPFTSSLPLTNSASFHPLTPPLPSLTSRVGDQLYPSAFPSANTQPAKVEVTVVEGQVISIQMVCARRPGLLLSLSKTLEGLGLHIQQAVISCFDGIKLDVFRAEHFRGGPCAHPEEIKMALLQAATFQAM